MTALSQLWLAAGRVYRRVALWLGAVIPPAIHNKRWWFAAETSAKADGVMIARHFSVRADRRGSADAASSVRADRRGSADAASGVPADRCKRIGGVSVVRADIRLTSLVGLLLLATFLTTLPACNTPDDTPWTEAEKRLMASLSALPDTPPPSRGNRFADDPRAVELGHHLFFDQRLSSNGKVSCATCHVPEKYFTDGLAVSKGVGTVTRNAPTLMGAQSLPFLFHDGRKDSMWSQALGPMEAEPEHGIDRLAVAHHVSKHFKGRYEALFGPLPALDDTKRFPAHARPVALDGNHPHQQAWAAMLPEDQTAVNMVFANVGKVLEAYQRQLWPRPAPFDHYAKAVVAGRPTDEAAFPVSARRGLRAFLGKAQCVNCHNGPLFTDGGFHNLGTPPPPGGRSRIDIGRSLGAQQVKADAFRCGSQFSDSTKCEELRFLNPQFDDFLGAFKTPTLRHVAKTAPYFHTGQMGSLEEVMAFYKALPGQPEIGHRELILGLLDPKVDSADLVAFLHTLTGPLPETRWLAPPKE